MSDAAHLAQMANDIGNFFRAQTNREDAIAGIANHITSYWTHRMQDKLLAQIEHGGAALDELPREALRRIAERRALETRQSAGGNAR